MVNLAFKKHFEDFLFLNRIITLCRSKTYKRNDKRVVQHLKKEWNVDTCWYNLITSACSSKPKRRREVFCAAQVESKWPEIFLEN